MKHGPGEEKFEICVYTHLDIYIPEDPYRTTPISVVRPGLEASLRSATKAILEVLPRTPSLGKCME